MDDFHVPEENNRYIFQRRPEYQDGPISKRSHVKHDRFKQLIQKEGSRRFRINDKLKIDDIPGTKADTLKKLRFVIGKNTLDTSDIQGSSSNANQGLKHVPNYQKQLFTMNGKNNSLTTRDISGANPNLQNRNL